MAPADTDFEVRRPTRQMMPRLYRLLGDVFEPDRSLMERVCEGVVDLANWDHFVLCRGDEIVSHVALVHMQVLFEGRPTKVAGIASVFTLPAYREQGLARRVLQEALAAADQSDETCVLFSWLPRLYERFGFRIIRQEYHRTPTIKGCFDRHGLDWSDTTKLIVADIDEMKQIYAASPGFDGKLLREGAYWPFYQAAFNGRQDVCMSFCREQHRVLGYVRLEREARSALITEYCAVPDADEVVEALLARAFDWASDQELPHVAFALPAANPAWAMLKRRAIETVPDDTTPREPFMARLSAETQGLSRLQWSLSDKF